MIILHFRIQNCIFFTCWVSLHSTIRYLGTPNKDTHQISLHTSAARPIPSPLFLSLFLYISLPLFCTTVTWNFQKLLRETSSYTFYGGNVGPVLFHCRSFSPWWPLASRRYKISFCSSNRKCLLLFFLSRSSSFPRWASLACRPTLSFSLSFSFSFSLFQFCGHDN